MTTTLIILACVAIVLILAAILSPEEDMRRLLPPRQKPRMRITVDSTGFAEGMARAAEQIVRLADVASRAKLAFASLGPRLSHTVPILPVDSIPMCVDCGRPTMHMGNVCYACSHPSPSAPAPPLPASTQDALPRGCASYTLPPVAVAALAEPFPHENAGTPFFTF